MSMQVMSHDDCMIQTVAIRHTLCEQELQTAHVRHEAVCANSLTALRVELLDEMVPPYQSS